MSNSPKELIARTGRVQSWIDDPTSRLPVSCTVFVVEDEMEGPNGIEASWRFVSPTLSAMERELLYTYPRSVTKALRMARVLWHLGQYLCQNLLHTQRNPKTWRCL
jgi:hypothetical protein